MEFLVWLYPAIDFPAFLQACTSLEQKELLEELAESVGAPAG